MKLSFGLSKSDTRGCPAPVSVQGSFQGWHRAGHVDGREGFEKVIGKENIFLLL